MDIDIRLKSLKPLWILYRCVMCKLRVKNLQNFLYWKMAYWLCVILDPDKALLYLLCTVIKDG
jgi:hypothetical protein